MNPDKEMTFTFREAALGAGLNQKTIRNWLDKSSKYGLILEAETVREGQGWRRFTLMDIIRIAAMGDLVRFCVPVEKAAEITFNALRVKIGRPDIFATQGHEYVFSLLSNLEIYVWPNEDGWDWHILAPEDKYSAVLKVSLYRICARIKERLFDLDQQ